VPLVDEFLVLEFILNIPGTQKWLGKYYNMERETEKERLLSA
jgi:hypothetical protein